MRARLLPLLLVTTTAACSGGDDAASVSPQGGAGAGGGGSGGAAGSTLKACVAPAPPAEATRKVGKSTDGVFLLPGGRALSPAGVEVPTGGSPTDVRVHPTLPIAYLNNLGFVTRSLQVIDVTSGAIVQTVPRGEAFGGLAVSADGKRLYASGGNSGLVEVYDVAADGKLTAKAQVKVGGYVSGLSLTPDGKRLFAGRFLDFALVEVDCDALTVTRTSKLPEGAFDVAYVPGRDEVWVTAFRRSDVFVVDAPTGNVKDTLSFGKNPEALLPTPDGARVFLAMPDTDSVIAIDAATRKATHTVRIADGELLGEGGAPLPASSPTGLSLDEKGERLMVARAGDSAVSILKASDLSKLGSVPTGWYPSGTAVKGGTLVVANAKGRGSSAYTDEKLDPRELAGTVSLVKLDGLDLAAATKDVERNTRRPDTVYPFDCDGEFPIPTKPGGKTPIEHVILVVKENKTFDSLLGDLPGVDGDPKLATFSSLVPNTRAIAQRFAHHENFYDDSETSTQGHLWLTSAFVNHYIERTWPEDYRGHGDFGKDPGLDEGQPTFGTLFTHLLKHKVDFLNFGEVVGSLGSYGGETVLSHTDTHFPGLFWTLDKSDEQRARYFVKKIVEEDDALPPFTFIILPRDHTSGTGPDTLSPESFISDNDYGLGLLVDGISKSRFWKSTAIFVVEDDPQQGLDHVDYHRSICLVASPWAKRGHVSKVHTSYPSIFRSIELIFGLPPINRFDANATPMWDAFTMEADFSPYDALARTFPDKTNAQNAKGAMMSKKMDFSGPDKNPLLGEVLHWHMTGAPPKGGRLEKRLAAGSLDLDLDDDDDEEERRERALGDAHQHALDAFFAYAARHPELRDPARRVRARDSLAR